MGFSLKKLVKHAVADVNPFDGAPAPPRPASTAQPHQSILSRGLHDITHNPVTNVIGAGQKAADRFATSNAIGHGLQAVALGGLRSGIGTGQAVSGLYDLATPGTGNNRFSKNLGKVATNVDQTAKAEHVNPVLYHGAQAATDALQLAVGAGEAKLGAKAITETPKVAPIATKFGALAPAIEKQVAARTAGLAEKGFGGRVAADAINNAAKPGYQAANAGFTALQVGKNASQGKQTTPLGVTTQLVAGGIGIPVAGALAKEATAPIIQGATSGLRNANLIAPSRLNPEEVTHLANFNNQSRTGAIMDEGTYQNGIAAAQKAGINYQDPQAIDDLLGAHRTFDTAVQQRKETLTPTPLGNNGFTESGIGAVGKDVRNAPTTKLVPTAPKVGNSGSIPPIAGNALTSKVALQNISPEAQRLVSGEHIVRNTRQLAADAERVANNMKTGDLIDHAHERLAVKTGSINDQDVALVNQAIERAGAEGRVRDEADLHDSLSEHLTQKGQDIQAASLLYRLSPNGMFFKARRDLQKVLPKGQYTPEMDTELKSLTQAIRSAPDQEAKDLAKATLQKYVADKLPQTAVNKAISVWKAGLLSGVKTQQGNAISNATFSALKKVSDPLSATIDRIISLKTGKRSVTATGKGLASGGADGTKKGWFTLKTGIDKRNAGDKYEQHGEVNFTHPVIDKTIGNATRFIFRGMNAADQPFWYSSFKNSMYDQAKASGMTKGLRGNDLNAFMEETVKNPTSEMAETALKEANKSTLNYDTIGSKAVQGIHKGIDNMPGVTEAGKSVAHGVVNILAPFVRVPTAFLSRTIDFTPLGIGKEVFHQIASKTFDQRTISKAIGEGLTGAGAIAMGVALSQHNLLSGNYPKNDAKEAQRWKAEGITPNSVKLGNKWVSLNYLGPLGLLFNAGHQMEQAKDSGAGEKAAVAVGGLGQGLLGQSFLQGFSGFSDAINDPERNLKSFVNSQGSSVVPNISNDVANATDPYQRQPDTLSESVKNRIPGLRETVKKKQDVYGNELKQPSGEIGTLIGVKPSNDLKNKSVAVAEVDRLHNVDPRNKDLQITPTTLDKSITVNGKNVKLSNKQRYDLQKQIGQDTQSNWDKLIKMPEYQSLGDTDKANALNNLRQASSEDAQRKYVLDNNLGTYDKRASSAGIRAGTGDLASFAREKGSTIAADYTKSNDAQYKDQLAKYNDNIKNNRYDAAQKIKASNSLQKAKVGSAYPKDIRDLYGLSKNDLADYLESDPKGNAKAKQLITYDQALTAAGLQAKNKFKNGVITRTATAGSKSRSASNSKFAAALKAQNSAASTSQDALLKLIKGAKVTSKSGSPKNVTVSKVALKKQSVKKSNQKVKVA